MTTEELGYVLTLF